MGMHDPNGQISAPAYCNAISKNECLININASGKAQEKNKNTTNINKD